LCDDAIQVIRKNTVNMHRCLENVLAEGVEAGSFARDYDPLLAAHEEQLAMVRGLVEQLASAEELAAESLVGELRSLGNELRLLEQEMRSYRDLLAEALSRAKAAPRSLDWERVRDAEEAYARGETRRFSRR
jgi:hypothetical protein